MPANGKRVSVATLGCRVNQYDTDAMIGALTDAGFSIVPWGSDADVCIVNTCTVTATADSKSRLMIRQAARRGAPVCVCGCLAERDSAAVAAIEGVAAVVPMKNRQLICATVSELAGIEVPGAVNPGVRAYAPHERTRGFLKIQEGCNNACAYCVIRSVRGRATTRPAKEILEDAASLARRGTHELILSGINISSYGVDNGASLTGLMRQLSEVDGIERIRLGSLDPWILTERTVDDFGALEKLCPHFHVSLQSGSGATLRRMNRKYTPDEYASRIELLRSVFCSPAITTDVMTGFPGETESDFEDSLDFVRSVQFAKLHVFPYSEREGTAAASMVGAVPVHERRERAARMMDLGRQMREKYVDQFEGTIQRVLFDRAQKDGASGLTDRYVRVWAPGAVQGSLRDVRLDARNGTDYTGTVFAGPETQK